MEGMESTPTRLNDLIEDTAIKVSEMSKGTLVTHLLLSELVGVPYGNARTRPKYYRAISGLQKKLILNHQTFLTLSPKQGYVITPPGSEIDNCQEKARRGFRQIARGVNNAQHIDLEAMQEKARTRTIEKVQKMGNVLGLMKNTMPEIE